MTMHFAVKLGLRLCVVAALLVTGAEAAPAPPSTVVKAPDWSVGSQWYYSDGYAVRIAAVSAKGTTFERLDAPGQWFMRQGFIRTDSASGTATRSAIYRTISDTAGLSLSATKPLTFQREYLNNGKLMVHASSWTVEGRETITVPAGTFDCWVIVWRTRSMKSDWTGFERWWYSPQAQNYVRVEYKYGPEEGGSRVLMRYNLAGMQPVAAIAAPAGRQDGGPPVPSITSSPPVPKAASTAATPAPESPAPVPEKPRIHAALAPTAKLTPSDISDLAQVDITPVKHMPVATPIPESAPTQNAALPEATPESVKTAETQSASKPRSSLPKGNKAGAWHAQLGAAPDAVLIRAGLKKLLARNPDARDLPSGVTVRGGAGRITYRAWLGSYHSAKEARALCKALKNLQRAGCAIFKGPTTMEARAD